MANDQAKVGIAFQLEGVEELLQQIGNITQQLSQMGRHDPNAAGGVLAMGTIPPGAWGAPPPPGVSPDALPQSAFGMLPSSLYPGASSLGASSLAAVTSITINNAQSVTITQAQQVTVVTAAIAGPGGISTSSTGVPLALDGGSAVGDAGVRLDIARYIDPDLRRDLSTQVLEQRAERERQRAEEARWRSDIQEGRFREQERRREQREEQEVNRLQSGRLRPEDRFFDQQYRAYAERHAADYGAESVMTRGDWTRMHSERWREAYLTGGTDQDFAEYMGYQAPPSGGGMAQFLVAAFPGLGAAFPGAGRFAGMGGALLAGYGAHLGMGTLEAYLRPGFSMQTVTREAQAAAMLEPWAGVPILGSFVQPAATHFQALDHLRNQAGTMAIAAGPGVTAADIEHMLVGAGGTWRSTVGGWLASPLGMAVFGPAGGWLGQWLQSRDQAQSAASGFPMIPGLRANTAAELMNIMGQGLPGYGANLQAAYQDLEWLTQQYDRPQEWQAGGAAHNLAIRMGLQDPVIGHRLLSQGAGGTFRLTQEEFRQLISRAATSGDLSTVHQLMAMSGPHGISDVQPFLATVGQANILSVQQQLAGLGVQQAVLGVSLAQVTLRGSDAQIAALSGQESAVGGQIAALGQQAALLRAHLAQNPQDLQAQVSLTELETRQQTLAVQQAGIPFQQLQLRHGAATAVAGAQLGMAQLGLQELRAFGVMPGAGSREAFGQIGAGIGAGIAADEQLLRDLRARGVVAPEILDPIQQRIEAARLRERTLPLEEIGYEFGALRTVAGARLGEAQARFGTVGMTHFRDDPRAQEAFQAVQGLIGSQIRIAAEELRRLESEGAGEVTLGPIRGEITRLNEQIAQNAIANARQIAQDIGTQIAQPGVIAGYGLATLGVTGVGSGEELAGLQATQQMTAIASRDHARREAARASQRGALEWEIRAGAAEAQAAQMPFQQAAARYQADATILAAATGGIGADVRGAMARGEGTAATLGQRFDQITAFEAESGRLRAFIDEQRAQGARPSVIDPLETQYRERQARVDEMRAGLGAYQAPVDLRERGAQAGFMVDVMRSVPGAYGPMREAIRQQMGITQEQMQDQEEQLRRLESSGEGNSEAAHRLRNALRGSGMQIAGQMRELSFGWESRLISRMMGAPGSFNLEGRGFALRDAVEAGVWNPHFGATQEQLPTFQRWAELIPQMGRPWERGPRAAGEFGVEGIPGMGRLASGRGRPEALAGAGTEGVQAQEITVRVIVEDPRGNQLGEAFASGSNWQEVNRLVTQAQRAQAGQ